MGHAGHGNAQILLCLRSEGASESAKRGTQIAGGILHVHAKLGRDHFVAAAAGVKLCAERAQLFNQRGFGEVVHVFGGRSVEPRWVGFGAGFDFVERADDAARLVVRENSGGGDGAGPGAIERKLLRQHASVEMPGALEFVKRCVGGSVESAAPHFLAAAAHLTAASSGTVIGRANRLMKPSAS